MTNFNKTMLAIPYIRSNFLGDELSEKMLYSLNVKEEAANLTNNINEANGGMFTRGVEVRSLYFETILNNYSKYFEQLVVLGIGLDTKYDKLECLADKDSYGIDIAKKDIEWIHSQSGYKTKVSLIEGDINHIENVMEKLKAQGLDTTKRTFIIWEGGTYYLNPSQVFKVLSFFRNQMNLVGVTVDLINNEVIEDREHPNFNTINKVLDILKNSGNQWKGFFDKREMTHFLKDSLKYRVCEILEYEKVEQELYPKHTCVMMENLMYFVVATNLKKR
ncbi:class I SAM-dependent methyltransferase [Enterococcus plantarum]|uniref:class I SAM-dependent methyltransferase n=1 Tax=Enterococcus TaxID=1350 RepID=UPI001A8F0115|nr:class I SAM-dependent methyltransferase [Enterococcus plantarum]MBO0423683.1 class I SAM-dependent methyltransferase [Enterococcus plantarum]